MKKQETIQKTVYMGGRREPRGGNRLILLAGDQFREYDLKKMKKDRIYFGRDETKCDVPIPLSTVSAVHGKIKLSDGRLYVGDVGSTNGTYLSRGQGYEKMIPRKYYRKESGDWILRIDSPEQNSRKSAVLILTDAENQGIWQCKDLPEGLTTIGRDPRNTIVMEGAGFSRQHAGILRQAGRYMLMDNGSMNGTYVNGQRVQRQREIGEKDLMQIAGSLFLLLDGKLMYQNVMSGVSLSLENVSKRVGKGKERKKILNQVSCEIGSNEFVAIIGGSGAGKTTVMNAMSGFDSDITGRVFCNGIDLHKNFNALKNMIGFVPQQDIIYENLTLRKMLSYTARMKMPGDTTKAERDKRILKVLEMVDLSQHANTYIRKLSGGQKKRASIAVEMLADPGLFFLDEPTSGLDPDTEQSLMHTLAKLSKSEGKTIVMVTHTTQSIHLCDKIIFMAPGGKICYCGPPSEINGYFGKEDLVAVYNELAKNGDNWNGYYLQNYMQERLASRDPGAAMGQGVQWPGMTGSGMPGSAVGSGQMQGERTRTGLQRTKQVSAFRQLLVLIARYAELIWNDRQRLMLLLIQPVAIAFLLAIVAEEDTFLYYEGTKSIMFALSCSGIWIGLFNTIQEVCKERPILKREYMGNLRLWSYILSKYIVQGLICIVQATLLTAIFLALMDHSAEAGLYFAKPGYEIWITIILTIYASAAMGLIVSSYVKNGDRAMAIAPFVLIIQLLFSGVLFDLSGAALQISKVTVSRWAMECLGNITNLNALPSSATPTGQHQTYDFFVRTTEHLGHTWEVLAAVAVICGGVSIAVLRNLKKDHR